ncbi:MAG: hypothetical protein WCB68_10495, partial [Pyrinomonadaceae bacterium]
ESAKKHSTPLRAFVFLFFAPLREPIVARSINSGLADKDSFATLRFARSNTVELFISAIGSSSDERKE